MSTVGQKRKLKDTDIPITDNDTPSVKQQKLTTPNDETPKEPTTNNTTNSTNTPDTNAIERKEDTSTEPKQECKDTDNNNENKDEEILDTETISKIKSQLEYYFGDSNLPLDTHILEVSNREENGGYYPISGLLTFKIIQSLTKNIDTLIKIIESSSRLQLNENKTGVCRHESLGNPPTKDEIYSRTIFAKGFHPRCQLNDLQKFWQKHTSNYSNDNDNDNILSIRMIRDSFTVGIAENNKPKIVKHFLGNCFVEFGTTDLASEFSKMTFQHNGKIIRCGMHKSYSNDSIEWKIKKKLLPFESEKVIMIRNIPTYSTWNDIKCWISNALYQKIKKKNNKNKCEYVGKEINNGFAYARFSKGSNIKQCIGLIKKKALMGIYPKVVILNDEQANKIWGKVAEMKWDINKDVEITIKNNNNNEKKGNDKGKEEEDCGKDDDNDVDIVDVKKDIIKEEKENNKSSDGGVNNNNKHKLDDIESTQPTKKQKTC